MRRLGGVSREEYDLAIRQRDECSRTAEQRHGQLMRMFRISQSKGEAVGHNLDAIREEAMDLQRREDAELQAKAAHIRQLLHDVRDNL